MNAENAKKLADNFNSNEIDYAEKDYTGVSIEITKAAKKGIYQLTYKFLPSVNYARVNHVRNLLRKEGFNVEVREGTNGSKKCYIIHSDWSVNES